MALNTWDKSTFPCTVRVWQGAESPLLIVAVKCWLGVKLWVRLVEQALSKFVFLGAWSCEGFAQEAGLAVNEAITGCLNCKRHHCLSSFILGFPLLMLAWNRNNASYWFLWGKCETLQPGLSTVGLHTLLAWAAAFILKYCWKRYLAFHHRRWLVNKIKHRDKLKISSKWYPHTLASAQPKSFLFNFTAVYIYFFSLVVTFLFSNERCKI